MIRLKKLSGEALTHLADLHSKAEVEGNPVVMLSPRTCALCVEIDRWLRSR